MSDELLSAGVAAKYLGITRQRLDQLAEEGRIKRQRAGRYWVYRKADLDAFRVKPKLKAGRPPTRVPHRPVRRPAKKDAQPAETSMPGLDRAA
jgi:excisionase family DNA binding protein